MTASYENTTDPQYQLTDETEEEFFSRREREADQAAWDAQDR